MLCTALSVGFGVGSHDSALGQNQVIPLQTGSVQSDGVDPQVRLSIVLSPEAAWSILPESLSATVRSSGYALLIDPPANHVSQLPLDPSAHWVGHGENVEADNDTNEAALYALPFTVHHERTSKATLEYVIEAEQVPDERSAVWMYMNEHFLGEAIPTPEAALHEWSRFEELQSIVKPGPNWLYLLVPHAVGTKGIIFSGRLEIEPESPDSEMNNDALPHRSDTAAGTGMFCGPLRGDFDDDRDVDLADYLALVECFQGPDRETRPGCGLTDLDGDGDTDLADLVVFQSLFFGSL